MSIFNDYIINFYFKYLKFLGGSLMKRKRLVAAIAAFSVVATLFAGCGSDSSSDAGKKDDSKAKLKVGLVTDQGGVHDGSFNESANRGISEAVTELGIEQIPSIESKQQDAYLPNLQTMSGAADLTVGAGFMMADSMKNIATQKADKKFLMIDAEVKVDNVLSVLFKEHEGSFLAGVLAGKLTKTNKIGFVGGVDGDVIQRFEAGFVAGVSSVNPEAGKLLMPKDDKTPGQMVKYVASFDDAGKGYEAAKMLINEGADIVYHAAGGAGLGVFKAVKELTTADAPKYAIGVDSDQAKTEGGKPFADVILFSMEKKVDVAVKRVVKELQDDKFTGGKTETLGLKEGAVGISPTRLAVVTDDLMKLSQNAEQQIKDGKITVPATRAELVNYKAPEIK